MKLFFKYISSKKNIFAVYFAFSVIFVISFKLYRLPLKAVIYPVILCAVLGIIILLAGYIKFRRKHSELAGLSKMRAAMISSLPEAESVEEQDYFDIIESLRNEVISVESEFSEKYRDMTEYYSVWAHQIKTPIASMKLTLQNEDSPAARKLNSELMRIEQYVEMVLAFIRLDSSSTDYVFRKYSVDSIIKQSVRRFASDFISKKIKLQYEEINAEIVTDEKWLSFVIEQILSNALKYTKEGSVRIYKTDDNILCIEDTGIGISANDLPRIFEKGYTGFNGRTDAKSSGIGLYLCRRVCDNLKIKISAESEEGRGTKICLDLNQNEIRHE